MYKPSPIDTSDVELSPEVTELAEMLARNTHEIWSQNRLDDGWVYGECRDDTLRTHPCLVPYDELPERERDYDRATSIEALKLITKLGFKITK